MKNRKRLDLKKIGVIIMCIIMIIVIITLIIFMLPGKGKVTVCSNSINQESSGYTINTNYKISSKKDIVKTVEITDVIKSSNKTVLSYFEKQYKNTYNEQNKKYGGYTINTETKGDSVIVSVTIDYSKVKLSELKKDNQTISENIKNNKLTLEGAKKIYTNIGATCK